MHAVSPLGTVASRINRPGNRGIQPPSHDPDRVDCASSVNNAPLSSDMLAGALGEDSVLFRRATPPQTLAAAAAAAPFPDFDNEVDFEKMAAQGLLNAKPKSHAPPVAHSDGSLSCCARCGRWHSRCRYIRTAFPPQYVSQTPLADTVL
jgi:hypothetical protein